MSRETYLGMAKLWDMGGRTETRLQTEDWRLMALCCWLGSDGVRREGDNELIRQFCQASRALRERQRPNWFDRLLAQRETCERCHASYRVENLALCTLCVLPFCHQCLPTARARNGNPVHACGGEVVG